MIKAFKILFIYLSFPQNVYNVHLYDLLNLNARICNIQAVVTLIIMHNLSGIVDHVYRTEAFTLKPNNNI